MRLIGHFLVAAFAGATLLALSGYVALADKRVALVVGNSSYQHVAKLPNPSSDASAIAEMFRKAGFDVVDLQLDAGNLEFKRAIRRFEDAASGADMAVAFFAGHGLELKGTNYMIPIDARLADERDAPDEAIALDRIVEAVDGAKRLRLVIVDACRDNPFAVTMKRQSALRNIPRGLGRVEPQGTDTLIAYAAKAGSTAEDGHGEHSPLTTALLDNLTVPGLDIRLAFGRVRDQVMKITDNRQEPFVYGSLGGGVISLVPPPAQPKEPLAADVKADYELVKEIGTRKAWDIFLNTYKTGFYADLAAAQLAKLLASEQGAKVAALEPQAPPPPGPSQPSSDEQRAWDRIRDSSDQAALEEFIRRYPRSPLALNAQKRLDILQQIAREREDKARADREAAQQRVEEERRAKAAEAERQKAEQQAALQRAEDERRGKAAEAEKQKAEQQAALQRAEDERRAKAAEAARQKAEQQKAEQQAALQRAEDERRAKAAEAEKQKAEQQAALQAKAAEAARQKAELPVPTEPNGVPATQGSNPSDVAALEVPPAPSPAKPSSAEARAWDRIKDSDNQAALQEFVKRYPKSPLVLNAQKRLDTVHQIAQEREDKARADREAAQQRAEDERRAKAAEAEKQKAEQQAALQRADEERRAKAAEAEKQKAEQQAALQRADEERRARAAEAEKQKAEQQAAQQRANEERRAKAAEAEKQKAAEQQAAQQRVDDERRAKAAEAEKQKAEQQAALQRADEERRYKVAEAEKQKAEQQAALQPAQEKQTQEKKNVPEVASNTSDLIHAAQIELSRLGCFSGKPDGSLNAATKSGIDRYLSRRGRPDPDAVVTESLVSELRNQQLKNCQLDCPSGQTADGEVCVAGKKSSPTTKSARQHDDVQEKSKPTRQPPKQEAKQADKRPERPQPQVHQEVSSGPRESHGGGAMIGVGF
jgi:Caspase domain